MRINPPKLGSLDPFVSQSIGPLFAGMKEYFQSPGGKHSMGRLESLVYAKLWKIERQTRNLVAGGPALTFCITMRKLRVDFDMKSFDELTGIIAARHGDSEGVARLKLNDRVIVHNDAKRPEINGHKGKVIGPKGAAPDGRVVVLLDDEIDPITIKFSNLRLESGEILLQEAAKTAFEAQPFMPPMQGSFVRVFDGDEYELPANTFTFELSRAEAGMPLLSVLWRSSHGDFPICSCPRSIRVLEPRPSDD